MATEAVLPRGTWSRRVLAVACLTALVVAFAPLSATVSCYESSTGEAGCTSSRSSLFADNPWILVVGMVPVLLVALPALKPDRWLVRTTAVVLTILVMLGSASIGLLFVPTLVLAWIAVVASSSGRN